ncbi:hypothetical protein L7F22_019872 [Adiantum nelumboides]|nr:hypothetical protein [Adiantum nelumboides]
MKVSNGAGLLGLILPILASVQGQRQMPFMQQGWQEKGILQSDNGAGRFLHITDMHPDKYYTPGAKINDACHKVDGKQVEAEKKKKKKKKGKKGKDEKPDVAGHWGSPVSVCDAPKQLISATLDWLAKNWGDSTGENGEGASAFDFIVWTGDTARHDLDFTHPRNAEEIFEYNRWALGLFENKFPNTPIVPNIGNNDIIPHNIMFPGPNSMTRAFRDIWSAHIPEEQHEHFLKGGYFVKDVLPNDLAVLSMNTLYWYDANAATRGCKKKHEPGSIQLDWLEHQLSDLRNRTMQAHLIGHVPPTAGNYFSDCYDRYTDIVLRYQDTIIGQHFGHMNIDAMFLQEDFTIASEPSKALKLARDRDDQGTIHVASLASDLRKDFDLVPTEQKTNLDAYLPFFASSAVVPTYLPTVRVWTYNNSRPLDWDESRQRKSSIPRQYFLQEQHEEMQDEIVREEDFDFEQERVKPIEPLGRSHRRPRHHKKHKKGHNLPRHASSDSPSRKNSYLTMLGYSHWVLDLEEHNKRRKDAEERGDELPEELDYQLEYTTYDEHTLWSDFVDVERQFAGHVHRPVPKHLLDLELKRRESKAPKEQVHKGHKIHLPKAVKHLTDYKMPSVTVEHALNLARELAGDDKLWKRFKSRIYTESGADD